MFWKGKRPLWDSHQSTESCHISGCDCGHSLAIEACCERADFPVWFSVTANRERKIRSGKQLAVVREEPTNLICQKSVLKIKMNQTGIIHNDLSNDFRIRSIKVLPYEEGEELVKSNNGAKGTVIKHTLQVDRFHTFSFIDCFLCTTQEINEEEDEESWRKALKKETLICWRSLSHGLMPCLVQSVE